MGIKEYLQLSFEALLEAYGGTTEGSGLGGVFDSLVSHLTNVHTNFLQKWDQLIDLEAKEVEVAKKEIWCSQSSKNDLYALSSLVLDTSERTTPTNFCKGNQLLITLYIEIGLPWALINRMEMLLIVIIFL
ncbi:hypothetical protein A4A49_15133 [Nicotiana attenuata]|uniref:Uncharacterized protein n=1 Tax=Nicotiana attenuata TaxID=49451 RepID=A0A314KQF3_NICAT|nr:hypothetical protein A4A49_15133 [Nicotiana attenuata]